MGEQSLPSEAPRSAVLSGHQLRGESGRQVRVKSWSRWQMGVIVVGLLCATPALTTGLVGDDYFHALVLQQPGVMPGVPSSPWDLFVWADGTEDMGRAFMETGMVGWWAYPRLHMAYARPVTTLTHWLDYAWFPSDPFWMHAHSLFWFALVLWGLRTLYSRVQTGPQASLVATASLALFAWDDAHGLTLSWVANRNALVALACSLLSLCLYVWGRSQGTGQPRGRGALLLSAGCMLVALLAGEAALALGGYLVAYALCVDRAGWRAGLRALIPHGVVVVGWAVGYRFLGYGAHGSGLAIDPGAEPLRFAAALAERLPVLLGAQLAMPPADLWEFYATVHPALQWGVGVAIWLILLWLGWAFLPLLKQDPVAHFWALGMVASAVPVCAQFPHDRLLLFVGVGAMGLLGRWLVAVLRAGQAAGRWRRWSALGLAGLHLLVSPCLLVARSQSAGDLAQMIALADRTIPDDAQVRAQTVVLVNPPMDALAAYIPSLRAAQERPRPAHLHWLATGSAEVTVTRLDAQTLRVVPQEGFLARSTERMQRSPNLPMPAGSRVQLSTMAVQITKATKEGRPLVAEIRFRWPLEDPRLVFLAWKQRGYVPFPLPPVGQSVTVPKATLLELLP